MTYARTLFWQCQIPATGYLCLLCAGVLLPGYASVTEAATLQPDAPAIVAHYMEKGLLSPGERTEVSTQQVESKKDATKTLPSSSHVNERLLCRVRERYTSASTVMRGRLAARLATQLQISQLTAENLLTNTTYCHTLEEDRFPSYLFYAGQHQETRSPTVQVPSLPTPPVTIQEPPVSPVSGAARSTSSAPTSSASSSSALIFGEATQESQLTAATMQRILCRVQERGRRQGQNFSLSIPNIAQNYADRWASDPAVIAAALRNDDLCTASDPATLFPAEAIVRDTDSSSSSSSDALQQPEEDERLLDGKVTETESGEEPPSWFGQFTQRLRQLPTTVLIVAGMAALTFLALIILLLAPLLKQSESK